jgi:hypothetical protein
MASIAKPVGYGPGRFFATSNVTNPTPVRPRYVQDMSVDYKSKLDELFGEGIYAAATAQGQTSVSGKVNFGGSSPRLWSDILSGDSLSAGQTFEADGELGTLASHAYTVTNTPASAQDRGAVNTVNNVQYTRVASGAEVAGASYSFAAGVYTFAVGETGTTFKFSYLYTPASATPGTSVVVLANTKQGPARNFQADMIFPFGTEQDVLSLYNCAASDAGISLKQGFGGSTFGFTAAVNDSDQLGAFSFARAA